MKEPSRKKNNYNFIYTKPKAFSFIRKMLPFALQNKSTMQDKGNILSSKENAISLKTNYLRFST